ncbi:hypothetical protein GCM10023238_05250 [Streptomyces heliomycini]
MQKTARDMILSLAVIMLVAGVVWLFIPHEDGEPDIKRSTTGSTCSRPAGPPPTPWPRRRACRRRGKPTSVRYGDHV